MIFCFVICSTALAKPKNLEVWFLSPDATAYIPFLQKDIQISTHLASRQCQPMGDYCFDPQIGLYKQGGNGKIEEIDTSTVERSKKYDFMEVPTSPERGVINCDKNHFFDVFCGESKKLKEKKAKVKHKLEFWMDTSSTMKQVDFIAADKKCRREILLDKVASVCGFNTDFKVYYFKEFKKEAGALDQVCLGSGLNNMERILQNIRQTNIEHLVIVTDIYEAQESFLSELDMLGAKIKGVSQRVYAKDLVNNFEEFKTFCK